MLEHETKFSPGPFFQVPDLTTLPGVRADAPDTIRLQAVYYDTDDFRLARAGASLRYRNVEGWTVKLPVTQEAGALDRQELHFDGNADDDPPEAALDLVHALARSAPLQPVARLNSVRTRVVLRDEQGAKIGEVVDDEVSVLDGIRLAARFRELEVELEEDAPESLEPALLARLRAAGAGHADPVPKIVRALGPRAADPPDVTPPPPLDDGSTPAEVVQAAIATSTLRLLVNDPGVRLGTDPEYVHQARVATRRLRSDLRTFRPLLDEEWSEPIRAELKWLGAILGEVRDTEVLQDRLEARLAELPKTDIDDGAQLLHKLARRRDEDRVELLRDMRSERYLALLEQLVAASRAPKFNDSVHDLVIEHLDDLDDDDELAGFVRKPWRKLRRAVNVLGPDSPDHELHLARIAAKRCRYAAEAVAPALGKEVKEFAKAIADLQDVLGEHQDAVVTGDWLRENSDGAGFVAGELAATEHFAALAARAVAGRLEAGEAQEAAAVDVDASGVVRAAGGIVRRVKAVEEDATVLLVHRPRYDDWTFPKGKNEAGERDEDAALREVEEETGLRCELGDPAGETRYEDSKGRPKVVRYWVMTPKHDHHPFTPNREVDAVHWCTRREAGMLLTYAHDRQLLAELPDDVLWK